MRIRFKQSSVLPGFTLTFAFTVFYLSLIVLIPLSALLLKSATMGWRGFWEAISSPRVLAACRLSFGASGIAATVNALFGFMAAWTLVRYSFPGKRIVDAMVDLPFALPTAVSGIALTAIYSRNGWIGRLLEPLGIPVGERLGERGVGEDLTRDIVPNLYHNPGVTGKAHEPGEFSRRSQHELH